MTMKFTWYPTSVFRGCDLEWTSKAVPIECDEIRFMFVGSHVGMDNVFSGKLVARLGYYEEGSSRNIWIMPKFRVMVGDQSKPSKFTIQGTIKLDRPIVIKSNTKVWLRMGPFPIVADVTQTVVMDQSWSYMSYFLRGNEISP